MNGGGNYPPSSGGTPNNRGHHFGGNHGQQNNIEYLRALNEAQYGGGVDFLSPLSRHVTLQQEIELRRRQIEEQHIISELEYQNQLRQLQQQQQLQGQLGSIYGQSFQLPSVSDEYLLQQQQQMLLQEQIAQQQMQAQIAQQRDREELISFLHRRASQNLHMQPTNSFMEEPLPMGRQSAQTVEADMPHESLKSDSFSGLVPIQTAAQATGMTPPIVNTSPAKRDPSPLKDSSPRKSVSPAKGDKPLPDENYSPAESREHKSQESKKPAKDNGKVSKAEKKSSKAVLVGTEQSQLIAESTKGKVVEGDVENAATESPPKQGRKSRKKVTKPSTKTDKEAAKSTSNGSNLDKEADILLNFAQITATPDEINKATEWNKESESSITEEQVECEKDAPSLSLRMKFHIPSAPSEPESSDEESVSEVKILMGDDNKNNSDESSKKKVKEPLTGPEYVTLKRKKRFSSHVDENSEQDKWWPSKKAIRQERRKRGLPFNDEDTDEDIDPQQSKRGLTFNRKGIRSMKKRMKTSVEPGVLEKLPYCKLYEDYCIEEKKSNFAPKFCCQTTETFPYKAMVCCSICSTWRHAQCGGHHMRYSPHSTDPSNVSFVPICDACYHEKSFIQPDSASAKRLDQQRNEHLRISSATNAVMRQFAYSKHAGPYKWPLGNVCATHLSGHTKSVAGRHEKSEKQWTDMIDKLGRTDMKARERLRVRSREFERIMTSVEDAEGVTDRHNMALFLRNDISKPNPVGFENPRRNIFDPEDDLIGVKNPELSNPTAAETGVEPSSKSTQSLALMSAVMSEKECIAKTTGTGRKPSIVEKTESSTCPLICRRQGCNQKPRFDSIFCSDSCGVSAVEADLLQSLEYASEMHPSSLR